MTTKQFIVNELGDLRALQRVFREAKFCTEADDDEISDSPIVAELFQKLMATLVEAEVETAGETARVKWEKWLLMTDRSRDEWSAALRRAKKKNSTWQKWTADEKREYVKTLFSPFVLSDFMVEQFLTEVDVMGSGSLP